MTRQPIVDRRQPRWSRLGGSAVVRVVCLLALLTSLLAGAVHSSHASVVTAPAGGVEVVEARTRGAKHYARHDRKSDPAIGAGRNVAAPFRG